jgi:hypothetical protein
MLPTEKGHDVSEGIGEQPGSKFVPSWGPLSDQIIAEAQRQLTLYDQHPSDEHWQIGFVR